MTIPHPESVTPILLEILKKIVSLEPLQPASLGGGTSLSLVFGHRSSCDIDIFLTNPLDTLSIQNTFKNIYENVSVVNRTQGSLSALISGIKVDILLHPYPLIEAPTLRESIPFLSLPDMAAMKINAVTNRGSKKDFSDLLLLHENGIELSESLSYFTKKYGTAGRFLALRSLNWFGDTEDEPDPLYLNGWTWPHVRERITELAQRLIR